MGSRSTLSRVVFPLLRVRLPAFRRSFLVTTFFFVTLSFRVAFAPFWVVTVIFTVPALFAVIFPLLFTVATFLLEDFQVLILSPCCKSDALTAVVDFPT